MRRLSFTLFGTTTVAGLLAALLAFTPATPVTAADAIPVAAAQPPDAASDLAMVPADAVGFVHVRLGELWKDEMAAGVRKTWEAAGPKALAALDTMFVPAPSTINRITAFVILDPDSKEPLPFVILQFAAPFKTAEVVTTNMPDAKIRRVAGKSVYTTAKLPEVAVTFPDNNHILLGMDSGMEKYLGKPVAKDGPLASAIKLAATRPVIAAANISALPIPPGLLNDVPPEVLPILKAQQLIVSLELGAEPRIEARAIYADEAGAKDAEKAVRALIDLGRGELGKLKKEFEGKLFDPNAKNPKPITELPEAIGMVFAIGSLNRVDGLLADPKLITRNGSELAGSLPLPREILNVVGGYAGIGLALLLPAVQKVRGAAAQASSSNNLKQLALAIHNYHDVNGTFPRDILDKNGKPILSWRVAILPYIEQDNIYKRFKMDEPWDSPNNKPLSQTMIKTFISPSASIIPAPEGYGMTSYKGVAGPGTIFDAKARKLRMLDVTDGLSNTVMLIEAGDLIPWAKPGDFVFDPDKPLPKLESPGLTNAFNAAMADGSVRRVDTKRTKENTIKAAFTRNGGEVLGADW